MKSTRRRFMVGAAMAGISSPYLAGHATGQEAGPIPDVDSDQTGAMQAAIDAAAGSGHLFLAAGRYRVRGLRLPSGFMLWGVPGATVLVQTASGPLLGADGGNDIMVSGVSLDGNGAGGEVWHGGLAHFAACTNVIMRDCTIANTRLNGITLMASSGRIENCRVSGCAYTGIFVHDATGVSINGNTVDDCANGGIRVWREASGPDGTIVSGNRISGIDWTEGGNGQNGNGINIFHADGVIVSDNHIADCTFSAIRLNSTNNTQVTGNMCMASGEVAIFSEFSFSGSIIANNIIDGAAGGISMTNYNDGGRLAVCSGNIVRNLDTHSQTNPDLTAPYGIAAEADAVIADNIVENVPGTGIMAGWGPYLRDVTVSGNLVRDVDRGIVVSLAPDAGAATIVGNTVAGARDHGIVGTAWQDVVTPDLTVNATAHPQIVVRDNRVL